MTAWLRKGCLALVAVVTLATTAVAQPPDGTMVFSRIANWQIARVNWPAYEADLKKYTVPVLDQLLADGTITEYGLASAATHTADGYTHSTWFSSKSIADLEKALAAIVAADEKRPASERRRADTEFAGTKHSDLFVRSRVIKGRATRLTTGYVYVAMDLIQPGKVGAYNERLEKLVRPPLDSLFASGGVTSFGIDQEFIHTVDPNARTRWVIVPDAAGLDKMLGATTAASQARTPAERQAIQEASREILVGASHRDELWQIQAYASKY